MIDFPASPSSGQEFSAAGKTWIWSGAAWGLKPGVIDQTIADGRYEPLDSAYTKVEADAKYLPFTGGTLTGDLTISKSYPSIALNAAAGGGNIQYRTDVWPRWTLYTSGAEGADLVGTDFCIARHSNNGTLLGNALSINRASGEINCAAGVTAAGVTSGQNFVSASTACVLATNGAGTIFFRPNGNAANEATLSSAGVLAVANSVTVPPGFPMFAGFFTPYNGSDGGFKCKAGDSNTVGGNYFNFYWNGSGLCGYVDKLFLGVTMFSSDYRVKKDVRALPSTWAATKALRPVSYAHTNFSLIEGDDIERWGFVAHELQETLIESAATGVKDQENCIQSPNPWTIIAALTKTVQECQARIEALEAP